jgi:hypothetical protein
MEHTFQPDLEQSSEGYEQLFSTKADAGSYMVPLLTTHNHTTV